MSTDKPDASGEERRRKRRRTLNKVIHIEDKNSGASLGRLVNITTEGLMLVNQHSMSTDSLYQIKLVLPEPVDGVDSVELGMDCLWTSPAVADAELYWSGCHIIDVSDEALKILETLIEEFGE
jgi:hypothetical protein